MKWTACLTMICAGALIASCAPTGDFCLSSAPIRPAPASADWIVANDRPLAEAILAHNEIYARSCPR